MPHTASLRDAESPQVLVDNRTSAGGRKHQFSVYDTYRPAEAVSLHAPTLLYCGMLAGRKRVHVGGDEPFEFLPGESLVVPAGQALHLDVPEAATGAPATCITLEVSRDVMEQVFDHVTAASPPAAASASGVPRDELVHFKHPRPIDQVLGTLVTLFTENPAHRDVLIDLNATELVVRLLETAARPLLLAHLHQRASSHGLAAAIEHIHDNLDRHLTAEELAEKACMSRSTFYRYFRREFGVPPLEYVNRQRMERAQRLLRTADETVTDVSYDLGFRSVSHFITTFKKYVGVTPKAYQETSGSRRPVKSSSPTEPYQG